MNLNRRQLLIAYDRAYANDATRDLGRLAAELVTHQPDLIYAPPSVAAVAAKQATRTIPTASARESADSVDRILRGARPAELPVPQATLCEVTVNAAPTREIGVELPLSLRVRATRVIE